MSFISSRFLRFQKLLRPLRYLLSNSFLPILTALVVISFELIWLGRTQPKYETFTIDVRALYNDLSVIGMALLGIAWMVLLVRINRDRSQRQLAQTQLKQCEHLLDSRAEEIRVSKATLLQRNATLQQTLSALAQTKEALEVSHQEVQVSRAALSQKADTLEKTVDELQATKAELVAAHKEVQVSRAALAQKAATLEQMLNDLQQAQLQMIQAEKMSSLGQLVAGIAHEINNPVNFIHANLEPMQLYANDLLDLISAYQAHCCDPALSAQADAADLAFIQEDLPKILQSMTVGTERIQQIVVSLQNFSRSDEDGRKPANVHDGLESSLLIMQHRLNEKGQYSQIELVREYGDLPEIACYPGLINQVFMNLLANAIDALNEKCDRYQICDRGTITLRTSAIKKNGSDWVEIAMSDTGIGISEAIAPHIFDAFFTTKPVGKGTGMGLSISYTIVTQKHNGELSFSSTPTQGSEFVVRLPVEVTGPVEPAPLFTLQPPVKSIQVANQGITFML